MAKVYLNDQLVDDTQATVPSTDAGFLYGGGIFETMRAQNGTVFSLDDHLDRLYTSAQQLGMLVPMAREPMREAIYQLLEANGMPEARLRLTLSVGSLAPGTEKVEPTLLIVPAPLQPYPDDYYQKGVLVVLCPFRQNILDPLAGHKTTSYFTRMLGLQNAHQKRAAEGLWFTVNGHLAEGCISNVFLVKDGKISTPPINTPILPGIARKATLRLAEAQGIEVAEDVLSIEDLLAADEVFLTNVVMKVLPVNGIEKHTVGDGEIGPVTKKVMAAYDTEVANQCGSAQ